MIEYFIQYDDESVTQAFRISEGSRFSSISSAEKVASLSDRDYRILKLELVKDYLEVH